MGSGQEFMKLARLGTQLSLVGPLDREKPLHKDRFLHLQRRPFYLGMEVVTC